MQTFQRNNGVLKFISNLKRKITATISMPVNNQACKYMCTIVVHAKLNLQQDKVFHKKHYSFPFMLS